FPRAAVTFEELVCFGRAPGARVVIWKITCRDRAPHVEHRSDNAPGGVDHIGTLKERRVADHTIVEQPFVAGSNLLAEVVEIVEVHVDRPDIDDGAGDLRSEVQGYAFVRLYVDDDAICAETLDTGLAEKD